MHERKRAERALDALSFFVSDARYGLGAYLGVYLIDRPPLSGPGGMLVQGWPLRHG